jgi:hypothetical protein
LGIYSRLDEESNLGWIEKLIKTGLKFNSGLDWLSVIGWIRKAI